MKLLNVLLFFFVMTCSSLSSAFEFCVDEDRDLFVSVVEGDINVLRKYLRDEGDPNFNCWDYRMGRLGATLTLSYYVVKSNDMKLLKLFVESDKLSQSNLDSMLHIALSQGDILASRYLFEEGAIFNSNAIDHYFFHSFEMNDRDFVSYMEFLDLLGGDFSEHGYSLFRKMLVNRDHRLNENGFARSVSFLSDKIDISQIEKPFINEFICSIEKNKLGLLLEVGLDVNKKDRSGNSAILSIACCNLKESQFRSKLSMLLKSGADFKVSNKKGEKFEDIARSCDNSNAITLLDSLQ